ncbi:MAG TPA: serine/threonine-protein kinase [Steroidobacteraceae bacterium]|jgi:serine/threonine-protein kinase
MSLGVEALTAVELAAGGTVGPYRLVRGLGSGLMSDVWLASHADERNARAIALKLPFVALDQERFLKCFARERLPLSGLTHPCIARVYDAGIAGSRPYVAMEYVQGVPLPQYCDRMRLGIDSRLLLFDQVLEAVQHAHSMLVIHRDLKPSSLIVTSEGQVLVLDFGVGSLLIEGTAVESQTVPLGGRALGPDYASPEQLAGKPLGIGGDLYSLGVILCELLAGARPYRLKRFSRRGMEEALLNLDPAIPSTLVTAESAALRGTSAKQLARTLRGDLDTIILKSIHKRAVGRYATVEALAQELRRFRRGEVLLARHVGPLQRMWTRASRKLS